MAANNNYIIESEMLEKIGTLREIVNGIGEQVADILTQQKTLAAKITRTRMIENEWRVAETRLRVAANSIVQKAFAERRNDFEQKMASIVQRIASICARIVEFNEKVQEKRLQNPNRLTQDEAYNKYKMELNRIFRVFKAIVDQKASLNRNQHSLFAERLFSFMPEINLDAVNVVENCECNIRNTDDFILGISHFQSRVKEQINYSCYEMKTTLASVDNRTLTTTSTTTSTTQAPPRSTESQKSADCKGHNIRQSGYFILDGVERLCEKPPRKSEDAWTIVQKRVYNPDPKQMLDFSNRNWHDYEIGFGDVRKEFWAGNIYLHNLTKRGDFEMKLVVEDEDGKTHSDYIYGVRIGSADEQYKLTFGGSSNQALLMNLNQKFTTSDMDNDLKAGYNCADELPGGWWFSDCTRTHLNGEMNKGFLWHDASLARSIALRSSTIKLQNVMILDDD